MAQKDTVSGRKRMAALLACLILVLSHVMIADAAEPSGNRTVKAGIFAFDGYHMRDEEGNLSGYGIDFLELVSEYSHLNFVYAGYDNSWNEMIAMLEAGEIDLVTSARKTAEREEKFAFSLPIGRNHTVLSVKADNEELRSGDYKTYDGMLVGLVEGSSQNQRLVEFAREHRFSYRSREFGDSEALAKALQEGTIDAILSSNLRKPENERTLDTIQTDNFYAIVRKEDAFLLEEVDYAIGQMNINEGDWSNVLFYEHYGPKYADALTFTEREQAYIQEVLSGEKSITVTGIGDRKPYSYVEDGELKGIMPEYFDAVMALAGLPYQMVVPKDREDYDAIANTNGVDVVIDKRGTDNVKEEAPYRGFHTNVYMTAGIAKVTRKSFSGTIRKVAVARNQDNAFLMQEFAGDAEVLDYPTREDALQAVYDGSADAAYVYTYAAQQFVNNDYTGSLRYSVVNSSDFQFRMYVRDSSDHELVTILNKCISQIPGDVMNQLVTKYTSYTPGDVTFLYYMRSHPEWMVASALVFATVVSVILALVLKARWNRKLLGATEKSNRELEEQLAIVGALSREYQNVYALNTEQGTARIIKLEGYVTPGLENVAKEAFPYETFVARYLQGRVYPEDRQELAEALSVGGITKKLETVKEYTGNYRGLEGEEIHNFQFTFVKMEGNGSGKEGFVLLAFRNIDDMLREEQHQKLILEEALAEARYANNAKTTFLNNMSHDIRTPMNAILGFTSLAMRHIDNQELVENYLGKITTSGSHLLSLINDVLDMSRIESGKVKIEEKEASLPEIMHDLKTIVQSDVKAKQLDFYIDTLDVANEIIICDKLRLNQVLLNILSNAMKYTRPGGTVLVRIIQTTDEDQGYASYEFRVKDTGIGMGKEFLKHLFEPFEREQTATISGIQGTGLGLAITKNIVDMMKGTIQVESEEGKGTEFIVSFRFRVGGSPQETENLAEWAGTSALVVDDDVHTCTSVSKMLVSLGMRADWTTLGKEAVIRTEFALEQERPFGLYLIDWLMPDMNGIEIVRRIRRSIGEAVPIFILTAYDWADIEEEAREAGVTAFCSKPVFRSELCRLLAEPGGPRENGKKEQPSEDFSGRRILLVEDNEINQEIAKTILEEAGFVIDTADDGTVAVEKMGQAPQDAYDLILMDIQMPRMNGYEATKAIRAMRDPVKSAIPIVAMTANAFEEDKVLAIEAGMDGHIAKPIDIVALMQTLKDILNRSRRR